MCSTIFKNPVNRLVSTENQKLLDDLCLRKRLPLVDKLTVIVNDLNLSNTLIIAVQHLCWTTEILFDTLLDLKLPPKNLYVLGKCYSTNPEILYNIRKKEINALVESSFFNCSMPFDVDFDRNLDEMIKEIISSNDLFSFDRIIILDDGGHLLERATLLLPKGLPIVGIEQTSSGFNRMQGKNLSFPVINLARSWLKLEYESVIIISVALKKLKKMLDGIDSEIRNVLIIGNGVLGQKIYEILKDRFLVSIYDELPEKSTIAQGELKERLKEFDLIIGCTGFTSLTFDDYRYLKKPVILASISSSDREFDSFHFRKLNPVKNCHDHVTINGITLLNCGFPITFDADYDSTDTVEFEITRALLLASIYQSSITCLSLKGFLALDHNLQKFILKEMNVYE